MSPRNAAAIPRKVAVAVIVSLSPTPSILVVSSRKHPSRFVLPKGGVEHGESSVQAALRESWEESGLKESSVTHSTHLLTAPCSTPHPLSPSTLPSDPTFIPNSIYFFELFIVKEGGRKEESLAVEWPERLERKERKWIEWVAINEAVGWGKRKAVNQAALAIARGKLEG